MSVIIVKPPSYERNNPFTYDEQQQRNSAKMEKALLNMRRSKTGGRRDRYWWKQAKKYFSKT